MKKMSECSHDCSSCSSKCSEAKTSLLEKPNQLSNIKKVALKENIEYINVISHNGEKYNSVIVALFPYYAGEYDSYLSKYTRGMDYHRIGKLILEKITDNLGITDCEILIDVSPHNERLIALRAGLGVLGKNGLLINEKYGSFVFIGTVFLNLSDVYEESEINSCLNCGKCIKSCPFNAIKEDGIDYSLCLSHITQKRQITKEEENMIKEGKTVWGCDICQDVCPHNSKKLITPIKEFKENLLLSLDDIDSLSNKEFMKKYSLYSLAYKGKKILKRNINIVNFS